jgi:hypothetical protein
MPKRLLLCAFATLLILLTPSVGNTQNGRTPDLIEKYWGGDDSEALTVAYCESRYDEQARRPGSQYVGAFQIGVRTHAARIRALGYTEEDLLDAGKNTVVAYDLWKDSGWDPWACRP